jgi:anti-sigma factor RsiW
MDEHELSSAVDGPPGLDATEVTHELIRGQFTEYLDGSLGESDRRRVDTHLGTCPPCRAFLNTFRATVRALGTLPAPKAPAGIRARIVEQVRREPDPPSP